MYILYLIWCGEVKNTYLNKYLFSLHQVLNSVTKKTCEFGCAVRVGNS